MYGMFLFSVYYIISIFKNIFRGKNNILSIKKIL